MAVNFTDALTPDSIVYLNDAVRGKLVTSTEKKQIAAATGVSLRTVQRWFTTSTQRSDIVPSFAAGYRVSRAAEDCSEEMARRLILSQMFADGITGDNFTGAIKDKTGVESNIVELVDRVGQISLDRYWRAALTAFSWYRDGTQFQWVFDFRRPEATEASDVFAQDLPPALDERMTDDETRAELEALEE